MKNFPLALLILLVIPAFLLAEYSGPGLGGGGAISEDAPADGQEYVRKDLDWSVSSGGGGGGDGRGR